MKFIIPVDVHQTHQTHEADHTEAREYKASQHISISVPAMCGMYAVAGGKSTLWHTCHSACFSPEILLCRPLPAFLKFQSGHTPC